MAAGAGRCAPAPSASRHSSSRCPQASAACRWPCTAAQWNHSRQRSTSTRASSPRPCSCRPLRTDSWRSRSSAHANAYLPPRQRNTQSALAGAGVAGGDANYHTQGGLSATVRRRRGEWLLASVRARQRWGELARSTYCDGACPAAAPRVSNSLARARSGAQPVPWPLPHMRAAAYLHTPSQNVAKSHPSGDTRFMPSGGEGAPTQRGGGASRPSRARCSHPPPIPPAESGERVASASPLRRAGAPLLPQYSAARASLPAGWGRAGAGGGRRAVRARARVPPPERTLRRHLAATPAAQRERDAKFHQQTAVDRPVPASSVSSSMRYSSLSVRMALAGTILY